MAAEKLGMQNYQSVKDILPPDDGKHYEVMVIMLDDTIAQTYCYKLGTYNNGSFHVDHNFYFKNKDFRNSSTQKMVIAWKALDKASSSEIRQFYKKVDR